MSLSETLVATTRVDRGPRNAGCGISHDSSFATVGCGISLSLCLSLDLKKMHTQHTNARRCRFPIGRRALILRAVRRQGSPIAHAPKVPPRGRDNKTGRQCILSGLRQERELVGKKKGRNLAGMNPPWGLLRHHPVSHNQRRKPQACRAQPASSREDTKKARQR